MVQPPKHDHDVLAREKLPKTSQVNSNQQQPFLGVSLCGDQPTKKHIPPTDFMIVFLGSID